MNREELRNDSDYKEKLSGASCDLEEIQGVIYGGVSSRFWMMRKYYSTLSSSELKNKNIPLYSW